MLTVQEAARRLGVTERSVYRWLRSGTLPAYRFGGAWRIDEDDLKQWGRRNARRS